MRGRFCYNLSIPLDFDHIHSMRRYKKCKPTWLINNIYGGARAFCLQTTRQRRLLTGSDDTWTAPMFGSDQRTMTFHEPKVTHSIAAFLVHFSNYGANLGLIIRGNRRWIIATWIFKTLFYNAMKNDDIVMSTSLKINIHMKRIPGLWLKESSPL